MVRFQCIHCGGRIAVPDDHMDRLARCPECGGVTHPLAEHLAAPEASMTNPASHRRPGGAVPANSSAGLSSIDPDAMFCDNCGEPLGKLQKQFEWDGHSVCGPCHRMLSLDKTTPKADAASPDFADSIQAVQTLLASKMAEQAEVNDRPRPKMHPSEISLAIRTAVLALCLIAVALYVIVSVLQSLGYLIMWGAIGVVVLVAIYWIRRGWLAFRRRTTGGDDAGNSTQEFGA